MTAQTQAQVLGLTIDNVTLPAAAAEITRRATEAIRTRVYFVNAHCFNTAVEEPAYATALRAADILYADGSGMRWAAARAGVKLVDNVNGTDLFPLLCEHAAAAGLPIALLGARPGVAARCAQAMQARYAGLQVAWTHDGYGDAAQEPAMIDALNASGARLLFVAMGVPRQELWLHHHAPQLAADVTLAVGALFDFYSGDMPRAPLWMRRLGLEWCYRLYQEPRRLFRRYVIGNPLFLLRVLKANRQAARSGPG